MGNMYFWNHLTSPWFPHSLTENSIMSPAQLTGRGESVPHKVLGEETWGWWQSENLIAAWHSEVKGVWAGWTVAYLQNRWLCYPCWKSTVSVVFTLVCTRWETAKTAHMMGTKGSASPRRQKIIYCLIIEVGWLWLVDRICSRCDGWG